MTLGSRYGRYDRPHESDPAKWQRISQSEVTTRRFFWRGRHRRQRIAATIGGFVAIGSIVALMLMVLK